MIAQDEYGAVLNRHETYTWLALMLKNYEFNGGGAVFAWTDEEGSQLDILFSIHPLQIGNLQRGIRADTDLFVSVMGFGAFGFDINDIEKHAGYVAEKLNLGGINATSEKLAELINGVIKELCNDKTL